MPTWKLRVEYEGTRYRGWQEQPGERTVAGELRRAAEDALQAEVDLGGAGRTDAGVHALAQFAHLRSKNKHRSPSGLAAAINAGLPADIHVLAADPAPDRFHARHDATGRSYLYQVSRRRAAFLKPFVWWVRDPLDLAAMRAAATALPGMHDFAAFSEPDPGQKSTKVELLEARFEEHGDLLLLRLAASHFLWKMVRRITGALVRVGTGELRPAAFRALVESGSGTVAEWTAPPSGLFLESVLYGSGKFPPMRPAIAGGEGFADRP
ncbi:MAG: tRNA pseudouridine(38-40) synthase TruA [Planctomycetes bacterium]|nr:tRNA pseudouridine(38-40) synthase TruA [Planctomycetota bacterium]